MKPVSKFFSDIVKSVSSSGAQVLITLVTTPLMTRLYDPAAYSAFGVIHALATTVVGVGLLSLPNAYPVEKESIHRTEMIQLMLLLLGGLVVVSAISAILLSMAGALEFSALIWALFPVLVLSFGIRQILVSVGIEKAHFSGLSVGQLVEPVVSRGGSIGLGAVLGGHPVFILASVALGHIATSVIVAKMVVKRNLREVRSLFGSDVKPWHVMKRYADFIIYNTPSQQAQPLAVVGTQMLIIAFFSHDIAGQYILATSILILPSSVVALATAPVIYRDFIERDRTSPETLARYLQRATLLYLFVGAIMLSPIFFFGEEIFKFVFGEVWGPAGKAAATLSIAYVGSFALMGVQSIFRVTKRMRTQFYLEVFTCAAAFAAVAFVVEHVDFETAILYLAVIWGIRNVILLCAGIVVTNKHANPTPKVS